MSKRLKAIIAVMKKAAASLTYTTFNPGLVGTSIGLSNGNLTATINGAGPGNVRSTLSKSSGKWYCELTITDAGNLKYFIGVADTSATTTQLLSSFSKAVGIDGFGGGLKHINGVTSVDSPSSTGSVIGIAFDGVSTCDIRINNALVVTGASLSGYAATHVVVGTNASNAATITANFGATPFVYSPPVGYNAGLY